MQKVIVASKNPVKMEAAKRGFLSMFPSETFEVEGVSVPSGVPDQPRGNEETLLGAMNRAEGAVKAGEADYYVGIEGGVEDLGDDMVAFAWIVVRGKNGQIGKGRTGVFFLPNEVARLVREGEELGVADDKVFGERNSKQNSGAVGLLTDNAIDRTTYYHHATILALVSFKHPHLY